MTLFTKVILHFRAHDLFFNGGRDLPVEKLKEVEVVDALKHPKLNTVKKITVDSATLFDKVYFSRLLLPFTTFYL